MKKLLLIFFIAGLLIPYGCEEDSSDDKDVISTSAGKVKITKAEIVSEFPEGYGAAPGYQILVVWFKGADGEIIDTGDFITASAGVYVIGNDGSNTVQHMSGLYSGDLFVAFTPPVTATSFTLHWNDKSIELDLSK